MASQMSYSKQNNVFVQTYLLIALVSLLQISTSFVLEIYVLIHLQIDLLIRMICFCSQINNQLT